MNGCQILCLLTLPELKNPEFFYELASETPTRHRFL